MDTLIRLGEVRKLVNGVMNILHKPTSACPDALLLALLQMQARYFKKLFVSVILPDVSNTE